MVDDRRSEAENGAARELLLALAVARIDGDGTTYDRLLTEATTEPATSLVLIDTFVRFLLGLASERVSDPGMSQDELVRLLALAMVQNGEAPTQLS